MISSLLLTSKSKWRTNTVIFVVLYVLYKLYKRGNGEIVPKQKTFDHLPTAPFWGWWYLFQLVFDGKNANRKLYERYHKDKIVKVKGITFGDEVALFDIDDCWYAHRHEGVSPGGAGDTLFCRLTEFYSGDGEPFRKDLGLGVGSHGANMFGRGALHNDTRALSMGSKMRCTSMVLASAKRVVDFVEEYDTILEWIQLSQIDMFLSVMLGTTPDLANPATKHELKHLPEHEEKAFVTGLLLSVLPKFLTKKMESEFVVSMEAMTGSGVNVLRDRFLNLPPEERPECFMKSLLENGGNDRDAEEYMALFITAFQGNLALTLHSLFYHVANDDRVQQKLYEEVVRVSKEEAYLKGDIPQMPYLECIFRESHRMTPITDFTQVRVYEHDLVLPSGWVLPAGTKVMMLNQMSIRDEKLVEKCEQFIPERYWDRNLNSISDEEKNLHHFLQRSEFGSSSSRSCLGRRTARVMMKATIIELFTRYGLEAFPKSGSSNLKVDTSDPSFNRIMNYPKIILHRR